MLIYTETVEIWNMMEAMDNALKDKNAELSQLKSELVKQQQLGYLHIPAAVVFFISYMVYPTA